MCGHWVVLVLGFVFLTSPHLTHSLFIYIYLFISLFICFILCVYFLFILAFIFSLHANNTPIFTSPLLTLLALLYLYSLFFLALFNSMQQHINFHLTSPVLTCPHLICFIIIFFTHIISFTNIKPAFISLLTLPLHTFPHLSTSIHYFLHCYYYYHHPFTRKQQSNRHFTPHIPSPHLTSLLHYIVPVFTSTLRKCRPRLVLGLVFPSRPRRWRGRLIKRRAQHLMIPTASKGGMRQVDGGREGEEGRREEGRCSKGREEGKHCKGREGLWLKGKGRYCKGDEKGKEER